jgi:tetratricopeptide (TPR) repeat protein
MLFIPTPLCGRGTCFSFKRAKAAKPLLIVFVLLLTTATLTRAVTPPPEAYEPEQIKLAQRGLDLLMNGDVETAAKVSQKIESDDPDSALGYLMEADALWWEIYFATGNLIDPDVFVVPSGSTTPYDSHFNKLVDTAIAKARANRNAKRDVARNYLYEGMAYGLRGRLASMRESNLAAARAAKQMRSLLITAVQKDRNLRDAYAGLGLYDYFVDTLPTIVKLLRWMIGLPGGSRERGIQEIEYAAKYGELTNAEALYYLAKNYSRTSEKQYAKSLELFQQLRGRYPHNGLWTLMVGSLKIRMGHAEEGEALYQEVLNRERGEQSVAGKALYKTARNALMRRHPGQRIQ